MAIATQTRPLTRPTAPVLDSVLRGREKNSGKENEKGLPGVTRSRRWWLRAIEKEWPPPVGANRTAVLVLANRTHPCPVRARASPCPCARTAPPTARARCPCVVVPLCSAAAELGGFRPSRAARRRRDSRDCVERRCVRRTWRAARRVHKPRAGRAPGPRPSSIARSARAPDRG